MSNILDYFGIGDLQTLARKHVERQQPVQSKATPLPSFERQVQILKGRGHDVEEFKPKWTPEQITSLYRSTTLPDEYGQVIPERSPYYPKFLPIRPRNVARTPANENAPDWTTAVREAIMRNMTPGQLPPPANDLPLAPVSTLDMPPSNWPGVSADAITGARPMFPPQAVGRPPSSLVGKEEKLQKEREGDPENDRPTE